MLSQSLFLCIVLFVLVNKDNIASAQVAICKGEPTEEFYRFLNRPVKELEFKQQEVPNIYEFVYSLLPKFDKSIHELIVPNNLCFLGLVVRRALVAVSNDSIVTGVLIEMEQTAELINTITANFGTEGQSEWTVQSVLADGASTDNHDYHFWRCGDFLLTIDRKKTVNDDQDTNLCQHHIPSW